MILRCIISKKGIVERRYTELANFGLEEIDFGSLFILEKDEDYLVVNALSLSLLRMGRSTEYYSLFHNLDAAIGEAVLNILNVLEQIEPSEFHGILQKPRRFSLTQVYYLGYERNAWHSTWINRYQSDRISFNQSCLKHLAEGKRTRGSVFKIAPLPMLVFTAGKDRYGMSPINERSPYEYDVLIKRIETCQKEDRFAQLPKSDENWLLLFKFSKGFSVPPFKKQLESLNSFPQGAGYNLGWQPGTPEKFEPFHKFCTLFERVFLVKKSSPRSKTKAVSM
jgi:hypothetical protein